MNNVARLAMQQRLQGPVRRWGGYTYRKGAGIAPRRLRSSYTFTKGKGGFAPSPLGAYQPTDPRSTW